MRITELRVDGVRNLQALRVVPGAINWFHGVNGAGKTSVLESIHLTAVGRSFRGSGRLEWLGRENRRAEVFVVAGDHRIGWLQQGRDFEARVDRNRVATRAEMARFLSCLTFHPQSHELISGPPEERRRLIDYCVFHVEPRFIDTWRHYRRALAQRNAGLRKRAPDRELTHWEAAMSRSGALLSELRASCIEDLGAAWQSRSQLWPYGAVHWRWHRGWGDEPLGETLAASRDRDRELGYTRDGPHRADLRLVDKAGLVAGRLSRGQQKLLALGILIAVARVLEERSGQAPLFCLDDLTSELDAANQSLIEAELCGAGWQVWVSAVEPPGPGTFDDARLFHVEQGQIREDDAA